MEHGDLEQSALSALGGIQRALGSDFVDVYERYEETLIGDYSLSKIVFLRLSLDESEPLFQLSVEARAHGYNAEQMARGIGADKIAPFDAVSLKLLDHAADHVTAWSFTAIPKRDEKSEYFSFIDAMYSFRRNFSYDSASLTQRAYNISSAGTKMPEKTLPSKVGSLRIIEHILRAGSLDTIAAEKLRDIAAEDETLRHLNHDAEAIRGVTPRFQKLTRLALGTKDFLPKVATWPKWDSEEENL